MAENPKSAKTTEELLNAHDQRMANGKATVVDILVARGSTVIAGEAKRGTIYFLTKGCLNKVLTSDVQGKIT